MNTRNESSGSESTNTVEIRAESIEPPSWITTLERFILAILKKMNITDREISVLLTDDETIRELNLRYRGINEATDVLSFGDDPPLASGPMSGPMGDIVIDLPLVLRQAEEYGATPEEEIRRVTLHGLLHLAGYHHRTNDFVQESMLRLQEDLLTTVEERLF